MLIPALLFKEEILKEFSRIIYTEDFFYYSGYTGCFELPDIKDCDNLYQYAIVNKNKVIGYLTYAVDPYVNCVRNFGLISFDKGNYIIGRELFNEMESLIKKYHRVEWQMIGGNPIKKHYDRFCEEHNGRVVVLHDANRNPNGEYCDVYIYEVVGG